MRSRAFLRQPTLQQDTRQALVGHERLLLLTVKCAIYAF